MEAIEIHNIIDISKLSFKEVCILWLLNEGHRKVVTDNYSGECISTLENKGYLVGKNHSFTKKAVNLFMPLTIKATKLDDSVLNVEKWIDEYRHLAKGLKAKSMGSKSECITKMTRFIHSYPEYADKELIIKARKADINSKERDYEYLRQSDYFIYKNEKNDANVVVEKSDLAIWCEEIKLGNTSEEIVKTYGRTLR